jgi:type I restriction enzyme S subunit
MNLSENNTVMNISSNYVTDDQISRNKWKPIDGNTIIFAKVGAAVFLERKRQTRCKFLIDNNMMSYKPNSIQDHDYIYYTFQNLNLSHYAQIGSLPSLNAGELKNVNIVLPDQNERSKVSQLFLNLDRTITLHEEKQRQLERLKKALLQKMFSDKTGYPALRFKGFTEKWEQVELNDIAPVTMGQSPNSKNYTENPNNYILVQGNADLFNGQVLPRIYTTQITKIAHVGDILMSVRAPVGNIAQTQYDVVIGRGVAAISGNLFIKQLLYKMDKAGYWNKYIAGSTFESVNSNDIKSANIKVPKLEEQEKIGQLFQSLDRTITLHDQKIQYLKQLKRGLLQKMFI